MSERTIGYMSNEDFDLLPRWQPQSQHETPLSSSQQAAQAAQASYLYGGAGPPPPPPQSLPPPSSTRQASLQQQQQQQQQQQSPIGASRQMRLTQLLDSDPAPPMANVPYSPNGSGNLSRSASLGGALTSRGRRRMQDDLEGAFHDDGADAAAQGQAPYQAASFYTPSVAYHHAPSAATSTPGVSSTGADSYQDVYYNGPGALSPRRSNTQRDPASTSRAVRSPLASDSTSGAALVDPYQPQQSAAYSPTISAYQYPTEHQRSPHPSSTPYSHSHSRSHSRVKAEGITSPMTGQYSPQAGGAGGAGPAPAMQSYSGYAMDVSTSPQPPPVAHPQNLAHLAAGPAHAAASISTPSSPLSYGSAYQQNAASPYYGAHDPQAMLVEQQQQQQQQPQQKRRAEGLRRVRDARDLQPRANPAPSGRRMDSTGVYLSPLRQLTTNIIDTYRLCNPQFRYESSHNPRRVLTKPSKPAHNEGYDNDDYDYILYVNDVLGTEEKNRYLILDILGQGTFGQVVKCQNLKSHEIVAVKVVKNKPAYFNQSMMEVTILELLNGTCDPKDEHHILRLRDSFIHKNHLCLVFELLSSNLYELIKQNQFQGLSTQLVKVFTSQLLDALTVLKEAHLIHCDLKPENILLKSLQSPTIKVIDFGSACHERQTVYTYIQSRFYRSPEVLLGIPYTASIDMWSLGCIAVELFLGLPLFPGTSEYNQITRIVEMLGLPPTHMLERGKQTNQFFDTIVDHYGQKKFRLKSLEQYSREHNTNEQPGKQYFNGKSLPEIINNAPMPVFKSSRQGHETEKELNSRASFIDFCQGLLNMDPLHRWSPQQARMHPFITGEKWSKAWQPSSAAPSPNPQQQVASGSGTPTDPKRPYGGLVPSQTKPGQRAYHDAASYNQHLAQHQAYTAQAAATQAAASQVLRNPYISPPSQAPAAPTYSAPQETSAQSYSSPSHHQYQQSQAASYQRSLAHQSSQGQLAVNTSVPAYQGLASAGVPVGQYMNPNPPASTYQSGARARSNTINQIDTIPAALARLQHMNHDVIAGRNALTPVMNRGDDVREWERRAQGKATTGVPYPQLEYLHQQAELAAASGINNWGHQSTSGRYPPPSSKLAHSYQPGAPQGPILVDDDRRDAVMSNVRSAARGDGSGAMFAGSSTNAISSPPQAYTTNATTAGNRYAATYPQQQAAPSYDGRTDMTAMYAPMQPDQYHAYSGAGGASASTSARQIAAPPSSLAPGFYGAGVVPTGQQPAGGQGAPKPYGAPDMSPAASQMSAKDSRRGSGMDMWPATR